MFIVILFIIVKQKTGLSTLIFDHSKYNLYIIPVLRREIRSLVLIHTNIWPERGSDPEL